MSTPLLSKPESKRTASKSRRRIAPVYASKSSSVSSLCRASGLVFENVANCPSPEKATWLADRLRLLEQAASDARLRDAHLTAKHGAPSSASLDVREAADWRRLRAFLSAYDKGARS